MIVLGVTGSIAAYKACELTRLLVKAGHEVRVVMTEAATRFVAPLSFQTLSRNAVSVGMFDTPEVWMPGHVSLAEQAKAMIIAPCTANVMAKLAHGLADDLLCATALATCAPLLLAPAMNVGMWKNAATQDNLKILRTRSIHIIQPSSGELACGATGQGRMADPADIMDALSRLC